jgi:uncharacterized protein (TIGR00269 family)
MKCRVCRGPAIIDLPRHNANFCVEHFEQLCLRQVAKAIDDFDMVSTSDRVLVAVSGGKDSLAVWDILNELGYSADGLYIGLGIGEYSEHSKDFAERFAQDKGFTLHVVSLRGGYDFDVPTAAKTTGRVPCSACGMSKRHIFDRFALENGYDVLVTGHNLDDEVAVLFGNTLRWDVGYLSRQLPVLDARGGFPKKVKPLVRLSEREMAAWCVVRNIEYIIEECPLSSGNRHLAYKEVMNLVEERSPGTKASFYLGFLENMAPLLRDRHATDLDAIGTCSRCSAPTGAEDAELCAFCRLQERASQVDPIPVDLLLKKRRHS